MRSLSFSPVLDVARRRRRCRAPTGTSMEANGVHAPAESAGLKSTSSSFAPVRVPPSPTSASSTASAASTSFCFRPSFTCTDAVVVGVHAGRLASVWFTQMAMWNVHVPFAVRSASQFGSPSVHVWFELGRLWRRNGTFVAFTGSHSAWQSVRPLPPPGTSGTTGPPAITFGCMTAHVEKLVVGAVATWFVVSTVVGSGVYVAPLHGPFAPQSPFSEQGAELTAHAPGTNFASTSAASFADPAGMPARRSSASVYESDTSAVKMPGTWRCSVAKKGSTPGVPTVMKGPGGTSRSAAIDVVPRIERPAVSRVWTVLDECTTTTSGVGSENGPAPPESREREKNVIVDAPIGGNSFSIGLKFGDRESV